MVRDMYRNNRVIRFYERYGIRLDGMEKEIVLGTPNVELQMIYTKNYDEATSILHYVAAGKQK